MTKEEHERVRKNLKGNLTVNPSEEAMYDAGYKAFKKDFDLHCERNDEEEKS